MNLCRNGHDRDVTGYYTWGSEGNKYRRCKLCVRDHNRRRHARRGPRKYGDYAYLWEFENAEYRFLRENGATPREIAERHGVKWESFQRALWRRVGLSDKW